MVLRVHVVREGGHAYYVDDLVPGRAEGSSVAGEEPGEWWGAGAEDLGRHARVDPDGFAAVLAGRDPRSDVSLRGRRPGHSVAGYDLTFGAPKSVSLLHLLGPREIAEQSGLAHRVAVAEALGYLERAAVGVRRSGPDGVTRLDSTGMVAGVFLHRTSRALDPHLHTHAVAANVARGVDGRWSAVDSRRLFAHAGAVQALYHARLRLEIGERLGGSFAVSPSGLGDVVGVDGSLRRLFSQRSAAMDEYRHRSVGRRSRRGAYFATRPDKDRTSTVESLRAEWRERAATFGFDLDELVPVVGPRREAGERGSPVDHRRMAWALGGLARRGEVLSRPGLVAVAAASSVVGATVSQVEAVADRLVEDTRPVVGEASGAAVDGGRTGPEPRWPAVELARSIERGWSTPEHEPPTAPSRVHRAGRERSGTGQGHRAGRERRPAAHELGRG